MEDDEEQFWNGTWMDWATTATTSAKGSKALVIMLAATVSRGRLGPTTCGDAHETASNYYFRSSVFAHCTPDIEICSHTAYLRDAGDLDRRPLRPSRPSNRFLSFFARFFSFRAFRSSGVSPSCFRFFPFLPFSFSSRCFDNK